ncbi:pikachurin isoform X2 [Narcine bancroftii]|uniref:pikachurin isoform X2 n=1 Tax=Narcine bancroftii TaxID=1343680 RepID=UPI0038318D5E
MGAQAGWWHRLPILFLVLFAWQTAASKRDGSPQRRPDWPTAPQDVQLEALNCTAFRVRWRPPRWHARLTGYTVLYTEVGNNGVASPKKAAQDLVLNLDHRSKDWVKNPQVYELVVGNLLPGTSYHVSVRAHGRTRGGRRSLLKDVTTMPQDRCLPPDAPSRPEAAAISDTEVALSWKPGRSTGSSALLYYTVEFTRSTLGESWALLGERVQSESMVIKDLEAGTWYQFVVRAVNAHGPSLRSEPSNRIRTLSSEGVGNGESGRGYTAAAQGGFLVDDSDIYIEKLHSSSILVEQSSLPPPPALPMGPATTSPAQTAPRGAEDDPCEETRCPPYSFCSIDYQTGGSRCSCTLGKSEDRCGTDIAIQYPKFYGHSYLTFEPLKNSYQRLKISMEFKAEGGEDGLLLYCGESETGEGDFLSLAIVRGHLHFRFDCGTGAALLVSERAVRNGTWHTVTISREESSGQLHLDNHPPISGRSKGHYSKITFRSPMYLGGAPAAYWLARVAGANQGFRGCVQSLEVNGHGINLKPWPLGQALSGADVGECSAGLCHGITCANGGSCVANAADAYLCLCPLGFRGMHCEEAFKLVVPHFNGSRLSYGSASWPLEPRHYLSFMEFQLAVRPEAKRGLLLYSHDSNSKDFIALTLDHGYLEFRFDCGSGTAIIRSAEPLSLNQWHDVKMSRTARSGILQVDDQHPVEGMAEGAFTQIRCDTDIFLGGVAAADGVRRNSSILEPFTGSIQNMVLNDRSIRLDQDLRVGVNVENAAHPCVSSPCVNGGSCRPRHDTFECDCPLGFEGQLCHKAMTEAIEIPQFIGRSYLIYDHPNLLQRVSGARTNIFLRFKTTADNGLLLWRGDISIRVNTDFISLGLQDGALVFSYNLGSGPVSILINGSFQDGQWHRVKAVREGSSGKLTVDDYGAKTGRSPGKMRQLNINGPLYVGGMKEIALHTQRQYMWGFIGCISHLTLATDVHVPLVGQASSGKNINTCGIK